LLASYGVDVDVIAKALCLKPSTVKKYVKSAMRQSANAQRRVDAPQLTNGAVSRETPRQPADARQRTDATHVAENQWISLLRSKGQR